MKLNLKPIRLKDRNILLEFLGKDDKTKAYPYYLNPSYLELNSNGPYKYTVIDLEDGDKVLACIKDIKMFSTKYWRILGYPISLNGNRENEDKVYNHLANLENVRCIWLNEYQLDRVGKTVEDFKGWVDNDFCSIIEDRLKYVSTSKYRSKNRLNIYKDKLNYRLATLEDKAALMDIREGWLKEKKDNKKSVSGTRLFKSLFRDYERLIDENSPDRLMVLTYENVILGYTIINDMGNGYYHQIAINNLKVTTYKGDNEDIKKVLTSIGRVMYYYIIKDLANRNGKVLTHTGSIRGEGLFNFKKNLCEVDIKYYEHLIRGD